MDSSILLQQPLKYTNGGIYMARSDIPSGWDKIRQNVQETERLMGQKQYNQSMIKARQTVEYMVKLQCDQAGIVESSMDAMIRELYNSGWISKSTAEHYLQIYEIGTKAAKNGDNGAYNANQAYHVLSQEIYSFADNGKPSRGRRPAGARPQQSRSRNSASERTGSGLQPTDILKFVVPIVLVIILIVLIRVLTPKKPATEETSAPVITTEAAETTEAATEPENTVSVSYKTTTTLNVRKEPSTDADRIGKLDPGASVEYLRDYDDTWAVIKYNGQEAYVAKEFLTAE